MKKTFQKTLIAAAAGVALMSAAGTASANSLLFPYFKVGAGVQSVLSLSNAGTTAVTEAIHYSYGVGTGACAHYDTWGKLTANDIISHSIAAPAIGGAGVFPANDTSLPGYLSQNATEGFLIVSNVTSTVTNALRGSMAVIEAPTGLFVSYAGIDNALNTRSLIVTGTTTGGKYTASADGNTTEGNFDLFTLNAAGQGPATAALNFQMTWLPPALVTTRWWALATGNMNAFTTGAAQSWAGKFTIDNAMNNVWDNEENYVSGSQPQSATCMSSFGSADLQTEGQKAAFIADPVMMKGTGSGLYKGVGNVTGAGADNVILMKLQTVGAPAAPFNRGTLMHRELGSNAN